MTTTAQPSPARTELLSRIKTAGENPGPFKALIFGPKGARKSVFCARAKNCLVLDTENGRRSLMNHPELTGVPVLPLRDWNDLDEITMAHKEGDLSYETWVIDTLDKLSNDLVTKLLEKAYAASPTTRNRYFASQAEYRVRNELFRRLTGDWAGLGVNLIFTAHASEVKDETTGALRITPSLSEGMNDLFGGFVELQGYMTVDESDDEKGEDKWTLQVHPTRRVDAKTRIGGLPRYIENPDINDLIARHYNAKAVVGLDQKVSA